MIQRRRWQLMVFLVLVGWVLAIPAYSDDFPPDNPWLGQGVADRVVTVSSPDNSFNTLKKFLLSAKERLMICVYQIDSPAIGEVLLNIAASKKVKMLIMVDGAPVSGLPQAELYYAKKLSALGVKFYFYQASQKGKSERTFKFVHAKYAIADNLRVFLGSGNYGTRAQSPDNSFGNREWEIVLESEKAASQFSSVLSHDLKLEDEWVPYGSSPRYTLEDDDFVPQVQNKSGNYALNLANTLAYDVPYVTVFAPDNSYQNYSPIIKTLESAQEKVLVEQLNFEAFWGGKPYNPEISASPLTNLILKLARKGKQIRILLNDDNIFKQGLANLLEFSPFSALLKQDPIPQEVPKKNLGTMKYLNGLAQKEGLDLIVNLLNYKACGLQVLHNKGMIVDDTFTLIGSLNWGESALKFNREAGVITKHQKVAGYYGTAFKYDWDCSSSTD